MRRLACLLVAAVLAACAMPELRPGIGEPELVQRWGTPTGRYPMPDGGTRLEYAKGPFGKVTWMVDLDASGAVQRWEQVLDEAHFARVSPGMPAADLLRLLGRPADRMLDFQHRETWSWRYETYLCLWFRVTLSPEGRVLEGGAFMTDPMCEPRDLPDRK